MSRYSVAPMLMRPVVGVSMSSITIRPAAIANIGEFGVGPSSGLMISVPPFKLSALCETCTNTSYWSPSRPPPSGIVTESVTIAADLSLRHLLEFGKRVAAVLVHLRQRPGQDEFLAAIAGPGETGHDADPAERVGHLSFKADELLNTDDRILPARANERASDWCERDRSVGDQARSSSRRRVGDLGSDALPAAKVASMVKRHRAMVCILQEVLRLHASGVPGSETQKLKTASRIAG